MCFDNLAVLLLVARSPSLEELQSESCCFLEFGALYELVEGPSLRSICSDGRSASPASSPVEAKSLSPSRELLVLLASRATLSQTLDFDLALFGGGLAGTPSESLDPTFELSRPSIPGLEVELLKIK